MVRFELTEDHLKLLKRANIRWTKIEYGAPGLDPKRPFGNSAVEHDVCEILLEPAATVDGMDVYDDADKRRAIEAYNQLDSAMQIVLQLQTFETGIFEREQYSSNWERVE